MNPQLPPLEPIPTPKREATQEGPLEFKLGSLVQIGGAIFRIASAGRKMMMLECMPGTQFVRRTPKTVEIIKEK